VPSHRPVADPSKTDFFTVIKKRMTCCTVQYDTCAQACTHSTVLYIQKRIDLVTKTPKRPPGCLLPACVPTVLYQDYSTVLYRTVQYRYPLRPSVEEVQGRRQGMESGEQKGVQ